MRLGILLHFLTAIAYCGYVLFLFFLGDRAVVVKSLVFKSQLCYLKACDFGQVNLSVSVASSLRWDNVPTSECSCED